MRWFSSRLILLNSLSILIGSASVSTLTIGPGVVSAIGNTASVTMTLDEVPTGLTGYRINITVDNPGVAAVTVVSYPSWATLSETTTPRWTSAG